MRADAPWLAVGIVAALVVAGCRTVPRPGPGERATGRAPLVLLVLDRARVPEGRAWRPGERVAELLDAAVLARTGAEFPLDGWAALAGDAREVTVLAVGGRQDVIARTVVDRMRLALGEEAKVRLATPGSPGPAPGAFVLVSAPGIDGEGNVAGTGVAITSELGRAGWPAPALVLANLARAPVGDGTWEAREVLVGVDPAAVAAVAAWQLRARLDGTMPPPGEAPGVRMEVLPVGE